MQGNFYQSQCPQVNEKHQHFNHSCDTSWSVLLPLPPLLPPLQINVYSFAKSWTMLEVWRSNHFLSWPTLNLDHWLWRVWVNMAILISLRLWCKLFLCWGLLFPKLQFIGYFPCSLIMPPVPQSLLCSPLAPLHGVMACSLKASETDDFSEPTAQSSIFTRCIPLLQ